jgi:hypothetical protein
MMGLMALHKPPDTPGMLKNHCTLDTAPHTVCFKAQRRPGRRPCTATCSSLAACWPDLPHTPLSASHQASSAMTHVVVLLKDASYEQLLHLAYNKTCRRGHVVRWAGQSGHAIKAMHMHHTQTMTNPPQAILEACYCCFLADKRHNGTNGITAQMMRRGQTPGNISASAHTEKLHKTVHVCANKLAPAQEPDQCVHFVHDQAITTRVAPTD